MAKKNNVQTSKAAVSEKTKRSVVEAYSKNEWLYLSLTLILCAVCLSPILQNGFINWDDNAHVFDNPQLKEPFSKALSYYFGPHTIIGNYIPITMTVYLLEYKMAGLNANFFHAVNLLFHLLNIILVYFFIRRLSNGKQLVALFVALFFGLHPMHVESVAWISELKDLLYTSFFLWALISYLKYLDEGHEQKEAWKKFPYLSFLLFTLSILSKPAALIFPFLLWLIDFYRGRKLTVRTLAEKLPFFVLTLVAGIIALKAQSSDRLLHNDYSLLDRLFFASYSLCNYLLKFFVPLHQSIFYPYPVKLHDKLPLLVYLAPLAISLVAILIYRKRKSSPILIFGSLFFLINLILVLQFVSFGDAFMAERYTYVPYIGLLFMIGMKGEHAFQTKKGGWITKIIIPVVVSYAVTFCYLSYSRSKIWKDDYSIATDLVQKYPNDWLSLNNMGYILFEQQRYNDAVGYFQRALTFKPNYARATINLSSCFLQLNAPEKALVVLDSAIAKSPDNLHLLANKANILFRKYNQFDEASRYFERALQLDNKNIGVYLDLSECYYAMKNYDGALEVVNRALVLYPDHHVLLNNKGYLYFLKGNYKAAMEYYQLVLKLAPNYQIARENLDACKKAMNKQ